MDNSIISTCLTKKYNVKFPFVAAGMAFVGSTPDLAIAVCEAGGIGSIGVGPLPPEVVRALVRQVKKGTKHPFNINFITLFITEDHIKVCIEENVPIVSFHFGHPPKKYIDLLHQAKIEVWEQVGSVENAKKAVGDGIDLVIAQGTEAGGHNFSTMPTFVLVPQIVEAVKPTLVLAAGGITTGNQVAAALCLGADGVWVGTRLDSTFGPEWPHFNPTRLLENDLTREFRGKEHLIPPSTEHEPIFGKATYFGKEYTLKRFSNFLPVPGAEANMEWMPLLAGQGVGLINEIMPAGEIVRTMMEEAVLTLSSAAIFN